MATNSKAIHIEKEFVLTDSSVNCYGFRCVTDGCDLDSFARNPIGYYMHDRDKGVVLQWTNIKKVGDTITAEPIINLSNPMGAQLVDEINNGFLRGASIGRIIALDYSDDPALKLAGQTGCTLTKWRMEECSIVDIPGNKNALCLLDDTGRELNLSDFSKTKIDMNTTVITKDTPLPIDVLASLGLKADSATPLTDVIKNLRGEADAAKKALELMRAQVGEKEIAALVGAAVADGRVNKAAADKLAADYAGNADGLSAVLDLMKPYKTVTRQLNAGTAGGGSAPDLAAKSYDELDKSGQLEALKAQNPEAFLEKFKTRWGKDYKEPL